MEIKSLADTDFDTLFQGFSQAFENYEIQPDASQFRKMLHRRGFHPELSFAAFEGSRIVAFTLNGIGPYNGIRTAYDTGTGTLKDYRGKGLATEIFNRSIPCLKRAKVRQYLLEVLQHNTKAISVYQRLGFQVTREFNYFIQENGQVRNRIRHPDFPFSIRQIPYETCRSMFRFQDFQPSWQNSSEALTRASGDVVCLGVSAGNRWIAYGIFEPESGDIAQMAVKPAYRRNGIGSLLLEEMMKRNRSGIIKILNTATSCQTVTQFLEARQIPVRGKQFEMIRTL